MTLKLLFFNITSIMTNAPIFNPNAMAQWLVLQHANQTVFQTAPAEMSPVDVAQATAVQNELVRIKSQHCGPTVGWKIALATPVMQQMVGLHAPIAGRLHAKQVIYSPASVVAKGYGRLLIEFEIAVRISKDLKPSNQSHTAQSVASSIGAWAPAFELADDRQADYTKLGGQGLQLLADNAWNEGAVIGQWQSTLSADTLASIKGQAFINGESVGFGFGADLMGHPLNAVAWLANEANQRGGWLKAGDVGILGSLVKSKFPTQGSRLRFELQGFEAINLDVN